MTDRELLELAAKAAGIEIDCWLDEDPRAVTSEGLWNPLADDGDALRLAVKLAIDIKIRNGATWWDRQERDGLVQSIGHEPHGTDPLAATRRAIVRAAAEIGKTL